MSSRPGNGGTIGIAQAKQLLNDRFLLIHFEKLCINPKKEVEKIIQFLNIDNVELSALVKLVKIQPTTGRCKNNDLSVFDKMDFEKVKRLGYKIESGKNVRK